MKRTLLCLLLALCLCAGTHAIAEDNFNPTGYPIVKEPITIKVVCGVKTFTGEPENLSMMTLLEEITGIHIEWIKLEDAQADIFFASGEQVDLYYNFANADRLQNYGVVGGMFANWYDYLEYMPNLKSWFEELPMMKKVVTEINGEMYALPMYNNGATSVATRFMFRTDHLDEAGLEMPTTIDEFYEALKIIKEMGITQGYAPLLPTQLSRFNSRVEPFLFASFGDSVDVDFTSLDGVTVSYSRVSEQYRLYLKFMHKLYSEELMEQEYLTIDSATTSARAKAGTCTFQDDFSNVIGSDFANGVIQIDQLAPLLSEYTDVRKTRAYEFVLYSGGMMSINTEYPREIARLVDCWFTRDELVPGCGIIGESFINGIYGRDFEYTTDDEGNMVLQLYIPEPSETVHANYLANYVKPTHSFGAKVSLGIGGTENVLARQKGYLRNNHPYQVDFFPQRFMKLTAEEQNVINNIFTDISAYVTEMRGKFIAGIEDIDDTWDSYVQTVYDMGLEDVINVYQDAYDRWNEN